MNKDGFGQYLVDEGLVTSDNLDAALQIQNKNRLLGEIAIEMTYLTQDDISVIMNRMETQASMKFGEAAISLGLLSVNQLRYLLDIRTRRKVPIGEVLVRNEFIEEKVMLEALMCFNQLNHSLEKVLIAEPNISIRNYLNTIIKGYGYTVYEAKTGKKALEVSSQIKPDILITSGILPDMQGLELNRTLISNTETSKVNTILLSSNNTKGYVEQTFESGITHFLKKPVDEKELINVIYQIQKEISIKREEKILVVDDNRSIRVILVREMIRAGFQVFQAENGRQAVEMASKIKPDIITMDLNMPIMGGFEACKALKENPETADVPVIIVSTETGRKVKEEGFEVGAVEFFEKPFEPGSLSAYVTLLLEAKKISKHEKILLISDRRIMRHMFKYLFNKSGYNVYTTSTTEEAMRLLPECNPDLIVNDSHMLGTSSYSLARKVKGNVKYRHIPIIMVANVTSREEILEGLAAGCNDYIIKPFDEAELLARTCTHLQNKILYDEVRKERDELERLKDQLISYSKKMETLARTDSLTGANNRRYFLELGEREIARAIRYKLSMSILIIDIDSFKKINDRFGHVAGDRAIKAAVEATMGTLRDADIFCRLGGEEFAAILVETSINSACNIAERIRKEIKSIKLTVNEEKFGFTVSIGVAMLREGDLNIVDVLSRADKALYQAKEGGRDLVKKEISE